MLRELLARVLPRWLAIALGLRRVVPIRGHEPTHRTVVPPIDTGGGFRASWREQDPSVDPREPNGGESSSAGTDHGWSNCTMTSGALALAYQQPRGAVAPWGGDLRHRQSDLSGGTDLLDLERAWSSYGEDLVVKSGQGWSAVRTAHNEGRAVVIQGTGNVPGSESFDGGHACCIAPETHSDGRWLFGDPLASGWQWVSESSIESWAERWQSSVAFAVGEKPPATPPPVPPPVPEPECSDWPESPDPRYLVELQVDAVEAERDRAVGEWVSWFEAGAPSSVDQWERGSWGPVWDELEEILRASPCDPGLAARWARGPVPDPVTAARIALESEATWSSSGWRELLWQ